MKHYNYFLPLIIWLVPCLSVAQRQVNVRALDITGQTSLHDYTLLIVHEKDTTALIISDENPPLTVLSGSYEVIIQKEGYRVASTDRWDCSDDTATILIEFRLLKEDATGREIRKGRRHSRKMDIDYALSPVTMGGYRKMRPGIGRHFTTVVYIVTGDSFATHYVAE